MKHYEMTEAERHELQLYRNLIKHGFHRPSEIINPIKHWIECLINEAILEAVQKERDRETNNRPFSDI